MSEPEQSLLVKAAVDLAAAVVSHSKAWDALSLGKSPEQIGNILGDLFNVTLRKLSQSGS